jgi:hypothetical protein
MTRHRRPRALLFGLVLVLASAAACEDPFKLEASRETEALAFEAWALNGTPDEYPSSLLITATSAFMVRPDANGNFSVAFDVDDDGKLVIHPMRLVVTPLGGGVAVNFIKSTATFGQILSAPATGWEEDSTITVDVGEAFLIRVFAAQCQLQLRQHIYVKLVADSIIPAERRARLRGRLNPNCGFRSFQEGIPEF